VLKERWMHSVGSSLRYNPDHDVEFPEVDLPRMKIWESWNLGYGAGVLTNLLLAGGIMSGPFSVLFPALSVTGGTVAPWIGERVGEKWNERKYSSGDVVAQDSLFEQMSEEDYLSRLNMDSEISNEGYERLEELRDERPFETWQTIRKFQFEEFERLEGISAWIETDSYDEAVRFAGAMLDEEVEVGRPSFLEEPEAFDHMMQYMDEESRVQMVWQALEKEPGEEMEELLDDEYSAYVEMAMGREFMSG
ncbi:MAG: hypothetical protein SVU32_03245, partial [Candidatus Nanohaloarchaea archaeon]|nr:hypothetical protein [Candidatus Nanohaloarchaea archaeon]